MKTRIKVERRTLNLENEAGGILRRTGKEQVSWLLLDSLRFLNQPERALCKHFAANALRATLCLPPMLSRFFQDEPPYAAMFRRGRGSWLGFLATMALILDFCIRAFAGGGPAGY